MGSSIQQEAGTSCLGSFVSWNLMLVEKSVKLETPQQESSAITWSQDRESREGWVSGPCTWKRD